MDFLDVDNDKLITTTACELGRNGRNIRGKLFVFGKRLTFCSVLAYSSFLGIDPKKHMFSIKLQQIESIQLFGEEIHIATRRAQLTIFRNFQQSAKDIYAILHRNHQECQDEVDIISEIESQQFNEVEEQQQILSMSQISGNRLTWPSYRKKMEPFLQPLLQLKKDHKYGKPLTVLLQDVSIADVFSIIFTDKPYRPTPIMRMGRKDQLDFLNPMHYLMEQVVGDRNLQATLWSPQVPEYLHTGNRDQVPAPVQLADLPQRTLVMDHPTKVPFFGEVCPQITLNYRLLLVDDKEFWIFVTTELVKMVYCENYKMRGYYKIQEVKEREFYIETRECVEWKQKLFIVSGQIDQASAKENERMFNSYVIPFMHQRRDEIASLRSQSPSKREVVQTRQPKPKQVVEVLPNKLIDQITDLQSQVSRLESHLTDALRKIERLQQQQFVALITTLICLILVIWQF